MSIHTDDELSRRWARWEPWRQWAAFLFGVPVLLLALYGFAAFLLGF
jgi:hypothetical protein